MHRNSESGMTLMELLVALVIGALVITLVVRGLGLSLGVYERVSRWTDVLDVHFREKRWWADGVGSLIACVDDSHCLRGDDSAFSGYTLAGVTTAPGERTPVRWSLEPGPSGQVLVLYEGSDPARRTVMYRTFPNDARLGYLGPDGQWYRQWNAEGDIPVLPQAIRIESGGTTLAYGATRMRTRGRPDYREWAGGGL